MKKPNYEVVSDGKTVWVNVAEGCIGRFGLQGIDIHRVPGEQKKGECLFCTHGPTTREHWDQFVSGMKQHHDVKVSTFHLPERFR